MLGKFQSLHTGIISILIKFLSPKKIDGDTQICVSTIKKFSRSSHIFSQFMSAFGPSRMYAQQAVAYSARESLLGETTNSTPESPPTQTPPDVEKLCELRKHVLQNLPTTCTHCGAVMLKDYIVDHKGSIIAYCKTPGACGRSLVLFAGVDFSYPVYAQTCRYTHTPAAAPEPVLAAPEQIVTPEQLQPQEEQQMQEPYSRFPTDQTGALDIYALHGIPNPSHLCDVCGNGPDKHKKCDQHGWYEVRRGVYTLPTNWPEYNARTKTWSNVY